jgi:hypothetical protein
VRVHESSVIPVVDLDVVGADTIGVAKAPLQALELNVAVKLKVVSELLYIIATIISICNTCGTKADKNTLALIIDVVGGLAMETIRVDVHAKRRLGDGLGREERRALSVQEAVDLEGGNISGVARESQHELVDNGVVTGEKDRLSRVT